MEDEDELAPEGTVANPADPQPDPTMSVRPSSELDSFKRDYANQQMAAARNRSRQFEQAAQFVQQYYTGPTQAERLFALSRALLSPRRMPGVRGTLDNMSAMLSENSKASTEAQRERAKAMLELQGKYISGEDSAMDKALQTRLELIKLSQGKPPGVLQDPTTGRLREKPTNIHRPRTAEEYAAIPPGEYYVIPRGARAGDVVMKQPE